jgi:hypothetical protein
MGKRFYTGLTSIIIGLTLSGYSLWNIVNKSSFYTEYLVEKYVSIVNNNQIDKSYDLKIETTEEQVPKYMMLGLCGLVMTGVGVAVAGTRSDYSPEIGKRHEPRMHSPTHIDYRDMPKVSPNELINARYKL